MKTQLFCLSAAIAVVSSVSAANNLLTQEELKKMTLEERKAYGQRMRNERTGGEIVRPGTQKGEIAVVDCRKEAKPAELSGVVRDLEKSTRFKISVDVGTFDLAAPKLQGGATLFIVDDPKLSMSLVAPEGRWAFVNVAPLREGRGNQPSFFNARVAKMMSRTFAVLCGAMGSSFGTPILGGVFKPEDLDGIASAQLPPDVVARFSNYLTPVGVTPGAFISYRRACMEGWAPAPTNEIQKVIWEQIKAESNKKPTNPIKITKDKK